MKSHYEFFILHSTQNKAILKQRKIYLTSFLSTKKKNSTEYKNVLRKLSLNASIFEKKENFLLVTKSVMLIKNDKPKIKLLTTAGVKNFFFNQTKLKLENMFKDEKNYINLKSLAI